MKVDLRKAYDFVEWYFIQDLLITLNFPNHFIKRVMACITTPKFTLLINGNTEGFSEANRGLKQGDPMPLLMIFVLFIEYLSRMLDYVGEQQEFQYFMGCANLKINHLYFADDLVIFCKGEAKSTYLMMQRLKLFTDSSGLKAKKNKSSLYCSAMEDDEINRIVNFSSFVRDALPFK